MNLIPGTTPSLTMQLDASIADCEAAQLCLRCGNTLIIKERDTLTLSADGTAVTANFTQAETLLLPDDRIAFVQLRVLLHGAAMATEVFSLSTKTLLYRKELMPDGHPGFAGQ